MKIMAIGAAAALLVLPPSAPAGEDIPVIRSGCSGGFTGGGSGHEIRRDGTIGSWREESAGSPRETKALRSDKAAADRLFSLFEEAGFSRIELHEPGNVTCFLTLESAAGSHTVSWSRKPPRPVRDLNDAVNAVATGRRGAGQDRSLHGGRTALPDQLVLPVEAGRSTPAARHPAGGKASGQNSRTRQIGRSRSSVHRLPEALDDPPVRDRRHRRCLHRLPPTQGMPGPSWATIVAGKAA